MNLCFSFQDNVSTATTEVADKPTAPIHLHSHLLLYTQVSDSKQILYTLQCIKNILQSNPRLCIAMLSTTSLNNNANSSRSFQIQTLLARHRKSVYGEGFVGDLSQDRMATYRSSTLIEVIISTCLYFLRSFYPNLGHNHLSPEEIKGNREVQLMSIDILGVLVSELILAVRDNGKAYATYISDLFGRCKVQKVVLHSLLAGVSDMQQQGDGSSEIFTEDVLRFNEIHSTGESAGDQNRISNFSEAFQVQVLRLVLSLVILEQVMMQKREEKPPQGPNVAEMKVNMRL